MELIIEIHIKNEGNDWWFNKIRFEPHTLPWIPIRFEGMDHR
ncbi:hypothetical protein EYZ11_010218 [Aspergillus tanneri]|uniref:Uncharacterized protein n=1 Tax=Aspergillus tanneri TaxID=1220188 RepID=A0A4S3J5X9_9EURO|nr:hypothetical protein EYZ11_010218 [Aspergillus tanneri]